MTENKKTAARYIQGFNQGDKEMILSCVTEDVVWDMPGYFHHIGKETFGKETQNPAFVGKTRGYRHPDGGGGRCGGRRGNGPRSRKEGGYLNAVFCDAFTLRGARIRKLTTYQVTLATTA